jgi:DNA repair protein RecO (recombination protein O)
MNLRCTAILLAARAHGETGSIVRALTPDNGLVAGYVAGGRGRQLRPVMIPGNRVAIELHAKSPAQLPFARLELEHSRAQWMTEPLPASAISWACALTASALPERAAYPPLYSALDGLLDAICVAPSARGWLGALISYEVLMLSQLGYGERAAISHPVAEADLPQQIASLQVLEAPLARYLLADARSDVMAARNLLMGRLARMA